MHLSCPIGHALPFTYFYFGTTRVDESHPRAFRQPAKIWCARASRRRGCCCSSLGQSRSSRAALCARRWALSRVRTTRNYLGQKRSQEPNIRRDDGDGDKASKRHCAMSAQSAWPLPR
eukprot:4158863-Pleurochrysis_carterae.AAC.1